jgi:ATP-binding cassette subfamily B (MDR/TAP) protein 1
LALFSSFVSFNFAVAYFFGLLLIVHGLATPFSVFQVIEALNMASITVMNTASYFPEYLRARIAAGLMFQMARKQPRIDSLSTQGITTVRVFLVFFLIENRSDDIF